MVRLLCGEKAANKIQSVPLSDNTVKRRIDDMATNCEQQLLEELANSKFAIQLDESTTISSEALLLLYVRYLNRNNELKNELLFSINLLTITRDVDIFDAISYYFKQHNLSFDNLVGCCSDGAASMMGKNAGFNSRLKAVAPQCRIIHCFIHRQALAGKKLSRNLNEVLCSCIKVINLVKAKALNARFFAELCADEKHQTLLLHTEVRWLSRGRVLGRLFEMCHKVKELLEQLESPYAELFECSDYIFHLAYLTDIFDHFNTVNLKMQGRDSTVIECVSATNSFCGHLQLWQKKLKRGETDMFPQMHEIVERCVPEHLCQEFVEHLGKLEEEIQSRFAEVQYVRKMSFVVEPFSAKTDEVSHLGNSAEEELLDLQHTVGAESFFRTNGYIKFWIEKGQIIAPTLGAIALSDTILPFATTYLAENAFSAVIHIKTKARNRLVLHNDLRLALTNLSPDIKSLCKDLQSQGSH